MMMWMKKGTDTVFFLDNKQVLSLLGQDGAADRIEQIGEGVYLVERTCPPTEHMELVIKTAYTPDFYMIPGLNYNGNGFGTFCEYAGDRYEGEPWVYGWHRAVVPAMSMSQGRLGNGTVSVSMFGRANDHSSFSVYREEDTMVHKIIWPEQESPKQLLHYRYGEAYFTKMEARTTFCAFIVIEPNPHPNLGYQKALDTAFLQNKGEKTCSHTPEKLWEYGIAFAKTLYTKEEDGFSGFNIGLAWENDAFAKRDQNKYEIGWCGQNGLLANALLCEAIRCPEDLESKQMGLSVLDSWIAYATLDIGVLHSYYDPGQERYLEACNLGTAALAYFEAYDLTKKLLEDRESYLETAMAICSFALRVQGEQGQFAKCYKTDGNIAIAEGTVGAFMAMPLAEAWRRTGAQRYGEAAKKALRYYMQELKEQGFTTAGALDIFSIDKESAIPLLKCAMLLYDITKEDEWLKDAELAAWYLSTWQYCATELFTEDTILGQTGYDSFGGTLVSTVHEGMDSFALCYLPELCELSAATGERRWFDRARAAWRNGCQHISDGATYIDGKLRPMGSQDESFELSRQSVWGSSSCWLVAWPGAFRMDVLRKLKDKPDADTFFE